MLDLVLNFHNPERNLFFPQEKYTDHILNFLRICIYKLITEEANDEDIVKLHNIGFLIDYELKEIKDETKNDITLKYYFFKDQLDRIKSKKHLEILKDATWGLPNQITPVSVPSGACSRILDLSRGGISVIFFTNWQKHSEYDIDTNPEYDPSVLKAEKNFFGSSKNLLLIASGNVIVYIHFESDIDELFINILIPKIYQLLTNNCRKLLNQDIFKFPAFLNQELNLICNDCDYGSMLTYFRKQYKPVTSWLRKFDCEKNQDIKWDSFEKISVITSHGFNHAQNLSHLATNLIWNNSDRLLKCNFDPISFFILILSCWIHDFGLTILPVKKINFENIFKRKKTHGFYLLKSLRKVFHENDYNNHLLKMFCFDTNNEDLLPFLKSAVVISSYHQKKAKISSKIQTTKLGKKLPENPYNVTLPSYSEVKFGNKNHKVNLRLLCAILRLLDAIDIRRNRALSTEANFSVLMKDVRSEFSVCNNCENKDCASKILKTIEAVLDFFQDYTVKYFTKAFTLKMYKTYEKKCIKWISEISNIIEKGACLVNCVDKIKILTMIIETPFHYGKHNTFLGVFFDENQKIVYLPDMKKTVEEINYFFNSCSITNVMNDFNSELTVDVKTILYDNGIQISDPILFNPLLHGKFLNQYFTIKRT